MSDYLHLQSADWRIWIEPSMGVQLAACQAHRSSQWLDIMPDCRTNSTIASINRPALASPNFHMLPYSNRIRDGQFSYQGQSYQLDRAEQHAIHGALRKRPWRVVESAADHLACEYDSRADGALNWPWPLLARISYTIEGLLLRSEISLTNAGDSPMPAGTGWHPYFNRLVAGAAPQLTLPVTRVYPDAAGDCLPDGPAIALPAELDFRQARTLDPDHRIDCCLAGLSGDCVIAWPDADVKLTISASANCTHLVLFNPNASYFAVEPVTNANDAFNLASQGIEAGQIDLQPDESLVASLQIRLSV